MDKLTEQEKQAQALIISTVEQALKMVANSLDSLSGSSGLVHISHIRQAHAVFLTNYKKGIEDANTKQETTTQADKEETA